MAKKEKHHKESLLHKVVTTAVSAAVMASVAGFIGYKLNSHIPELYYNLEAPVKQNSRYVVKTEISNVGNSLATEVIIRYTFDQEIYYCNYNYSEGLEGKLPASNVEGGKGKKELLLNVPRMLPEERLKASFVFNKPEVTGSIKVYSKEVVGRPYSEWKEAANVKEKFLHQLAVVTKSLSYRLSRPEISFKGIKVVVPLLSSPSSNSSL
jgi:hypothetical protein